MLLLGFVAGLFVGLLLLVWQRSRMNAKLKRVLHEMRAAEENSMFSTGTQLALAVSQQQRIQQGLERQLECYRQILNTAPIGFAELDDENRLVWCNVEARSLLGIVPAADPKPRLLLELVRSYELDQLVDQTRSAQQPCQMDWLFYPVSPDPSQLSRQQARALRGHGFPLMSDHVGIFLENRDEPVQLKQQRDRWASDVAHELKTPLTSIRLVAETLHGRVDTSLQGWVSRLINETIRLSNLVQDLLDLAQLDQEASTCLQLRTVKLADLVQAAWTSLEPLSRKKQIGISYEGDETIIVEMDEPRIFRVLINLFDNSIKYSPPWGTVQVRFRLEPQANPANAVLEIIDAGPGFPESALPHVFERFYKADPSRSRQVALENPAENLPGTGGVKPLPSYSSAIVGTASNSHTDTETVSSEVQRRTSTGLGLAIVRQIVEAHHGSVTASNHPGAGACLRLTLPIQQPNRKPSS
ncbi:ATP-binding protein [Leptolyngbya sp. AN02str]|uniref:ATP-binding protein n=1 Tax=Leptolyngbya sp. AN02str TaxID=3423363 RepID=UPI003D3194DE